MPNLNRVMLMGNLTRDPEMRYLPSNTAVTAFTIAINRKWRNQQGEAQEETTFVDVEAFGKTAETINQYMRKGKPIYLDGRLKLDVWKDKEGLNRSKLKVIVESFQFIETRQTEQQDAEPARGASRPTGNRPDTSSRPAPAGTGTHQPVGEEDIPF